MKKNLALVILDRDLESVCISVHSEPPYISFNSVD